MIKTVKVLILFICVILCGNGFTRTKKGRAYDCEDKIRKAMVYFQKKKFNQAKTILDEAKINCRGLPVMDTALFYLGKCLLSTNQPGAALLEFEAFIQEYPTSAFAEEVHFLAGLCSYKETKSYERDQAKTMDAIRKFTEMIELYPQSPFTDSAHIYLTACYDRLAKKEYENARFYEIINQHEAAIVYYKLILEAYPDYKMIPECKLALATSLDKVSRSSEALAVLDTLINTTDNEVVRKKAQAAFFRIQKKGKVVLPPSETPDVKTIQPPSGTTDVKSVQQPEEIPADTIPSEKEQPKDGQQ